VVGLDPRGIKPIGEGGPAGGAALKRGEGVGRGLLNGLVAAGCQPLEKGNSAPEFSSTAAGWMAIARF